MRLQIAALLLLASVCSVSAVRAQSVETIDLRVKSTQLAPPPGQVAMSGSGFRESEARIPVEVKLLDLDRDTYNYFDRFTYRVQVRNTSDAPLLLPRQRPVPVALGQPQSAEVRPQSGDIRCLLQLRVRLAGIEHVANTVLLGASADNPGQVLRLGPGQTVEFIADGRWDFLPPSVADEVRRQLPASLEVLGAFVVSRSPQVKGTGKSLSPNSLAINLLPYPAAHPKKVVGSPSNPKPHD
jgi:hypothetical protein